MSSRNPLLAPFTTAQLLAEVGVRACEQETPTPAPKLSADEFTGCFGLRPALDGNRRDEHRIDPGTSRLAEHRDTLAGVGMREGIGVQAVEIIPGQLKKDGTERKMITVGISQALVDRLNPMNDHRSEDQASTGEMRYIVRGAEREALANSFIDQWEMEIRELEAEIVRILGREQDTEEDELRVGDCRADIARLRRQIDLRRSSAFGGMTKDEVVARNTRDGAQVFDAVSAPGTKDTAVRVQVVTGIREFDRPVEVAIRTKAGAGPWKAVEIALAKDAYVGHFPKPLLDVAGDTVLFMAEPVLIWRIIAQIEKVIINSPSKREWAATAIMAAELGKMMIAEVVEILSSHGGWGVIHIPIIGESADTFRARTTTILQACRQEFWRNGKESRGVFRTIRIFNPDFQEKEIPDDWFHQTDGANPTGVQLQPHVDPRSAWTEVQEGPGVIRMKRPTRG